MATLADSRLTGPVTEINAVLPDAESEVSVLGVLALLASHKRFILRAVAGAAVFSTIVAFLLPVRYEANIVMMPPQQNSSIGSTLGQLGTGGSIGSLMPLASLASGGLGIKNPADMYVALLTSRTVEDAMVQRFGLLAEYHEKRLSDARKELENRTNAV